jgi:hypothetical protein
MDSCLKVETTALQSVMTVAGTCASSALHLMLSRKPYIYAAPRYLVITYLTPKDRKLPTRDTQR